MTDKGTLIVFSGPSGSGKGTILSNFAKKPQGKLTLGIDFNPSNL